MDGGRPVPGRQSSLDLAGPVCVALPESAGPGVADVEAVPPPPVSSPGSSIIAQRDPAVSGASDDAAQTLAESGKLAERSPGEDEGGRENEAGEPGDLARPEPDSAPPRSSAQPALASERLSSAPLSEPVPPVPDGITLEEALASVAQAAREWGVRSYEREGRFLSALMVSIRTLGRVSELSRAELRDISQRHLESVKVERDKARELARATEAALGQARSAVIVAEVERDQVVATMVEKTLPLFAKHMREVMVIRERAWNIDRRRRRDALAALVGVGLFLAGAGACAWWFEVEIGFAQSCPRHAFASQGHVFCNMDALVAARSQ